MMMVVGAVVYITLLKTKLIHGRKKTSKETSNGRQETKVRNGISAFPICFAITDNRSVRSDAHGYSRDVSDYSIKRLYAEWAVFMILKYSEMPGVAE